jgi:hypothetical protein
MRIPIFENDTAPTKETGQSFTIPGQRQVAFEVPKTKEVADLAMARVGDVMVDISEKMVEANDVSELDKLKSKTLEGYTASTEEIQSPEFQKNNPREEGEDTMAYYDRHRNLRANIIKEKVLGEFNGSTRARKRAEGIVSDYDNYNTATIASFARAKKIEELEFSLSDTLDKNARAAIKAFQQTEPDLNTYSEAIKNAKVAIESNIASGIVSGPRGEAMLKAFEKDVAIGVQSVNIDKSFANDLANMSPTSDKPKALMGLLDYIDKGDDPYLQDPRVKADIRNLVEAKISSYDVKYEKYMREVREIQEVKMRQGAEKLLDNAVEASLNNDTNAFFNMRKTINGMASQAVKDKVMSASQAFEWAEKYNSEATLGIYGRRIDSARETNNKDKLKDLMDLFSSAPSKEQAALAKVEGRDVGNDPHLNEPMKRRLYDMAAAAYEHVNRAGSTKDYIAAGEMQRMLENVKMDARKNNTSPNMALIEQTVRKAFSNTESGQNHATAILKDFNYDMEGEKLIYSSLDKVLKGGPKEEAEVLGESDARVAAGGLPMKDEQGNIVEGYKQTVHAVNADKALKAIVAEKREALAKDSVSYVNKVFDIPPQSFVKDMVDKKPFAKVDAEMLLQRQREVGTTPTQERLLTKTDADRIVSTITSSKAEEGLYQLQSLQRYFGDYWNVVNKDLMKSKLPNEFHIAASLPPGPDGKASRDAVLLVNASKMNKEQVSESLGFADAKAMDKELYIGLQGTDGYKNIKKSLRLQGMDPDNNKQLIDLKDSIHNLAIGYMNDSQAPLSQNDAIKKASEVIIDGNYNFASGKEGYRIPKQFQKQTIEAAARDIKMNFSVDDLYDKGQYRSVDEKKTAATRIKNYGYFVNDENGTGLILMGQLGHVASWTPNGKPRVYTWEELLKRQINPLTYNDYYSDGGS